MKKIGRFIGFGFVSGDIVDGSITARHERFDLPLCMGIVAGDHPACLGLSL